MKKLLIAMAAIAAALVGTQTAMAYEFALGCAENYSQCGALNLPYSCDNMSRTKSELLTLSNWNVGISSTTPYAEEWIDDDFWQIYGKDWLRYDKIGYGDFVGFNGHGTQSSSEPNGFFSIALGYPVNPGGRCFADNTQMKFGESDGSWSQNGDAEFVMFDACCSMVIGEIIPVWTMANGSTGILTNNGHQGFGFSGIAADIPQRGENFVENVKDGDSNQAAWLDAAEGCEYSDCQSSPAVITGGTSGWNAIHRAGTEKLTAVDTDPDGTYWIWTYLDAEHC